MAVRWKETLEKIDDWRWLLPKEAEAYRWRARYYYYYGEYELALADLRVEANIDGCASAFRTYNYDCSLNHLMRSNVYGLRGTYGDAERAVQEAKAAIEFYPELAAPYYLMMAAYYGSQIGDEDEARKYAELYLERAERPLNSDESEVHIEWARRVVSGGSIPDLAAEPVADTPALIVEGSELVIDGD